MSTMKVSRPTLKKLHRLAGHLAAERGRRVTLEDALIYLLRNEAKRDQARAVRREEFLAFVRAHAAEAPGGIDPEDSREYDFEDVGA